MIADSDGSNKQNWVTAALIIEGYKYTKKIIAAYCTSPEHTKYQDAYRGKLVVIFHMVTIVEEISIKFNISEREISMACDGLITIKKSMGSDKIRMPLKML